MQYSYKSFAVIVIIVSVLFRFFLAASLEFGNDEVYYWLYAKYPAISHFDHPPMVGFFIQLFTLNLYFDSELAIRLAAIIPSGISMYVVFLIANYLKNEKTGFIAVLLYAIHIYGFVIAGTFILPDSPLVLSWLLAFYFFIQVLPYNPKDVSKLKLILGFLFSGCAIYAKYQAVFLLFGVFLYVLLCNRKWLKNVFFYVGFLFPLFFMILIFYWNYDNDFISYKFHGDRVSLFSFKFNKDSFLREVLGQFLYNNPYVVIMFVLCMIAVFKKRFLVEKKQLFLFLSVSVPLILTTIYLSLFRDTLPHWSGISYITMLPIIALFITERKNIQKKLVIGGTSFYTLLFITVFVINKGLFLPEQSSIDKESLGRKDVLLDMYGWKQVSEKLSLIFKEKELNSFPIISNRWYPAAHIDYYIARPNHMNVYGIGALNEIHKYYWINKQQSSSLAKALFITDSRNYIDPNEIYKNKYSIINRVEEIPIVRSGKVVKYVFLYLLEK